MAYIYDIADVWSASGTTFTGIKLSVTDTASAAGSLLMDLQVGGVSRFSVRKGGVVDFGGFGVLTPALYNLTLQVNAASFEFDTFQGLRAPSLTLGANFTNSVRLFREADHTLAQRNGVNAQAFNLYNTYTDASNYERGTIKWSSNVMFIDTEKLGTGVQRHIRIGTASTGVGLSGGTATGVYAVACGNSQATNNYTFAAGESSASGAGATAIGRGAAAVANNAISLGYLTQAYQASQFSFSNRWLSGSGDCQMSMFVLGASTTDAAATEMSSTISTMTRMVVRASTTWAFEITVVGRSAGGTDNAMYVRRGMIKRDAANTTTLVGAVDSVYTNETNAAWDVAVTADDTNEALKVEVTGAAATNINWTAKVILTEVGRA